MSHDNNDKIYIKDEINISKDEKETSESESSSANESMDTDVDDYCSDATFLARKMMSQERLSQADATRLYTLTVQLRHTVPPQHKVETRAGSHMPSQKQIKKFEELAMLKRGVYSVDEDEIIVKNWKEFCKLHNWSVANPKPFLQMRIGTMTLLRNIKERRKFVQFLANGLPNRTLFSVYHRFKTLYEGNLNRRYKPEEDKMILDHLENNPSLDERRKYADLAKVLRRTRNSIWRRYRILKKKKRKNTS